MNIKIKSFKKSLFSACNKLVVSSKQGSFEENTTRQANCKKRKLSIKVVNHQKSHVKRSTHLTSISRSNSTESLDKNSFYEEVIASNENPKSDNVNLALASSSSGYGTTSVKSALSIFVNLDNYFYDENFAKIKDKAQENAQTMKLNIVNCLLEYQSEYLSILKSGLENQIRPMSALIDTKLFFKTFLNIEKIFTITEFIRNAINDSMLLTNDIYTSVVTIMNEYINLLVNTYEFYLKGYAQALVNTEKREFIEALSVVNQDFDLIQFIDLPIKNITKIYCAFMSLLEITPVSESDDHDRLNSICNKLKQIIGPSSDDSLSTNIFNMTAANLNQSSSFESSDFLEMDNSNNKTSEEFEIALTPKDLKYNCAKSCTSSTSSSTSTNIRNQINSVLSQKKRSTPNILPTDFTDFNGNKYYFL